MTTLTNGGKAAFSTKGLLHGQLAFTNSRVERERNQGRASLHRDRRGLWDRAEVPAPETSPRWGLESPEEVPLGLGAPPSLATLEQRRGGGLLRDSFVDEAPFQRRYHNSRPFGIRYQPQAPPAPRVRAGRAWRRAACCAGRLWQQPLHTCCCWSKGRLAACSCLALSGLAEARGYGNPRAVTGDPGRRRTLDGNVQAQPAHQWLSGTMRWR